MRLTSFRFLFVLWVLSNPVAWAGIYSGPSDTTHPIDPGIAADDSRLVGWATTIDASRTLFGPRGSSTINTTGGFNSLGDLDSGQIAAGVQPGFLTVGFDRPIANGAGHDFAVFENGFVLGGEPFLFAELAYVEVSTNGTDFARFPSVSTNTESDLITTFGRSFAGVDTTNIHNLAGKHRGGLGTPFDLDDLAGHAAVTTGRIRLDEIHFVRLVDIPGNGAFVDSLGNPILDPWVTSGAGGFDFRLGPGVGIGVINAAAVPEPSTLAFGLFSFLGLGWNRWRRRFHLV